jgi:hypothetical protein
VTLQELLNVGLIQLERLVVFHGHVLRRHFVQHEQPIRSYSVPFVRVG